VSEPNATPVRSCMLRTMLVVLLAVLGLTAVPAALSVTAESERQKARALAAEVAELDGRIDDAVARYAQANEALAVVRASIAENRRAVRDARRQVDLAQVLLAERAVSLYKEATPTTVDVLLGVADFGDLVSQLELLKRLGAGDADYLRALRQGERDLRERSLALAADEATAERLVADRAADVKRIRSYLDARRELLASAEARVKELAAETTVAAARPSVAEQADQSDVGEGDWWPIIKRAAAANDVSADGLYRLMMVESGGSATIVGPGGYHGLYQYSLTTWRGSWNPYRSASIYDGEAQIKATALAIARGYGPSFWPSTYDWAFRD
jgi:peptidoglycan hydrolase CwlO-like protein